MNLNDSGPGSLRSALAITPADGQIDFQPGLTGTILLTSGTLNITKNVSIVGPGVGALLISGGDTATVFGIASSSLNVAIRDMTITDGAAPFQGGGILSFGTLLLHNVEVTSSTAVAGGGGIYNGGILTLTTSTVSGNVAGSATNAGKGAGIMNAGILTLSRSSVLSNATLEGGDGAGIYNFNTASLTNSLVAGNASSGAGGGLWTQSPLTLQNSTIAGNVAAIGGGLAVSPGGTPAQLTNTIVALNGADTGPDVWGATAASTFNLIGIGAGSSGLDDGEGGNQVGTAGNPIDPLLGGLQFNGGPGLSVALLPGSPAIDAGGNTGAPATDQRGFNRLVNGIVDVGAYEYQPPATATVLTSNNNPSEENEPVTFSATVTGLAPGSNIPLGNVVFLDGGNPFGSATLINGVATLSLSSLSPGHHIITAVYQGYTEGDHKLDGSTSDILDQAVLAGSVTVLQASPGSSTVNAPVTLTASVSGNGPTPTGSVTFFYGANPLGTVQLSAGSATLITAAIPGGSHNLTAVYAGDDTYHESTATPLTFVVNPAGTTTQLTNNPSTTKVNEPVTLTATVTPASSGPLSPAGTVHFYSGGLLIGSAALTGNTATLVVSHLPAGTHSLTAQYEGNSSFLASSSPPVNQGVDKTSTTTLLTGDIDPSIVDQPVVITATILPSTPGPVVPTGTVSFFDNGQPLATITVANGKAVLTTTTLKVGDHTITAVYNGDGNYEISPTASLSHTVKPVTFFAVGGAPGRVRHYNLDNTLTANFLPYGPAFTDAIAVATGDVNGDGYYDLITGATVGNPHVKVYDGKAFATGSFTPANPDASLLAQWFPYALHFNVGSHVAVGDVNGDGFADIVTGATAGNPHVKVHDGSAIALGTFDPEGSLLASFFPYALEFNVGANVTVGDVDNDGRAEVITGATVGNPHVKVHRGQAIAQGTFDNGNPDASLMAQWFSYALQFNVGATVAVGDTDGDGLAEIITGASVGNPHVKVHSGSSISTTGTPTVLSEFFAYALNFNVGARVGAADFDGDDQAEILTGPSVGSPHFRAVKADSTGIVPPALFEAIPPDLTGGIYVAA
jgi:hypothetical protein